MLRSSFLNIYEIFRSKNAEFFFVVVGSVIAATLIRLILMPFLGPTGTPYVIYFISVLLSSWMLGLRGGVLAAILSILTATDLFLRPTGPHHEWKSSQFFDIAVVIVEWLTIAALGEAQLRYRINADASRIAAEQKSAALLESEQHLRLATDGANIGTWRWDISTRLLAFSDKMTQLFGGSGFAADGTEAFMAAVHPEDREIIRISMSSAIEVRKDFDIEIRVIWQDGSLHWIVVRGHCDRDELGKPLSLEGIAIDVTSRKLAEQDAERRAIRANSLNAIGKAIREMREAKDIQQIALNELAETLSVDRCLLILLDKCRDWVSFVAEWRKPELPSLIGEYSLADFDIDLDEIFPKSEPLVVADVGNRDQLSAKSADMLKSLQITALLDVPMSHGGEVISVLGVYMSSNAREWTADEISFVESVGSQLRAAVEADRALSEAQSRAEREALVNRITSAMRNTLDPEDIQERVVTVLGRALGADRCYFAVYDLVNGEVVIGRDWHRPDLPSVSGVHHFVNTKEMFDELYPIDSTSIVIDREASGLSPQTIENMKSLQLRSRVSVAIADSKGMATLTACMSDVPRRWDQYDIELIENVASQLRPTVEMARAQQREHRIATDLQNALLPPAPKEIPGLQLGTCMQPALDEAEIGGDFFDVFPLDKEHYAIVVGDVSGKGLAAAGQLATVRNSLRMSLYQNRSASISVGSLNTILTSHGLIAGFVTAFVSIYSSADKTLSYTSCGHEPALVLRKNDGAVEILQADGVPLGVSENAEYSENVVTLDDGDTLLLYTDGLSESGNRRSNLLGTQGLIDLFSKSAANCPISDLAATIVTEAQTLANSPFRDDVCVLAAKVCRPN